MRKKIILFIVTTVLCVFNIDSVSAANSGGNGAVDGPTGSTGSGVSCSYPGDMGYLKNPSQTYLFDLVYRAKGSTNFKHLGCVIIGPQAKNSNLYYDRKVHKNCKTISSLGKNANGETLANIAKYIDNGKDLDDLNAKIANEKNQAWSVGYVKSFGYNYEDIAMDNPKFGSNYGYRILIQKFIYIGCDSDPYKYLVPRKEAYRSATTNSNGKKLKVGFILGGARQGDLRTTQKDIGIKIGKKVTSATKDNFINKNDGTGYNILWFRTSGLQSCKKSTSNKKTTYYDLCLDANGNPTKDDSKCKIERKITKSSKDKNGNQLYNVPSLPNNQLTLTQVKNYIDAKCPVEGPKCMYNGNTCYDDAGVIMSTCDEKTKTWIDTNCEKQCWYDETTDAYYEDTSGQGTSIHKSVKRNVWQYSCNSSWNGNCSSPYIYTSFGSSTYNLPSPNIECNKTDSRLATNDCTYAKLYSNTKNCYYTTRSCEMVDDYETQTDDEGNETQVKVGEHEECTDTDHYGPSYTYSTTCNYNGQGKEYYIDSEKMWLDEYSAKNWVSTCKLNKQVCAFDKSGDGNDDAWYDNNGNYHPSGLTSKIALWINGGCKASKPKATVTCADCTTSAEDGTAFKYTETSVIEQSPYSNTYPVLGSYFGGNANNETDLIANHYLKDSNGNNEVYCSEELTIKLPNGQTTSLDNAQAGRYITINLQSPIENIVNMVPITITTTQTCSAIENKPVTVSEAESYGNLSNLQNYDSRDALKTYIDKKYEDTQNAKRADGLGGIKLKYDDKEYTINFGDEESELEQFLVKNDRQFSPDGNVATLTQEARYTLKSNIYQYTSIGDGSVSKIKPSSDKLSSYYNLGNSTLPIRFEDGVTNHVTFVYDYEGTDLESVFEDASSFPLDTSSKACVNKMTSESEKYYTCALKTGNKSNTIIDGVCKIQKMSDNTYEYYYYDEIQKKVVQAKDVEDYKEHCSCLEQDGHYYLNGDEIEEEDYKQICPAQCSTTCPADEICCPAGGTDMPCSVDGVCPNSSGDKLIYRTIDLSNPFPGQDTKKQGSSVNQGRKTGANWCSYNIKTQAINCSNLNDGTTNKENTSTANQIVSTHIKNNAKASEDAVYRQKPQYSITLNSQSIDKIRSYNKTQKTKGSYDDFTLTCYNYDLNNADVKGNLKANGIYTTNVCRSDSFIRNNNLNLNLSGTCANSSWGNLLTCSERTEKP